MTAAFTGSSQRGNAGITDFAQDAGRLGAMEAWVSANALGNPVLNAGDLEIRPDEFTALANGRALPLTMRELQLLTALAERQGRIVSRAELYAVVWGEPYRKSDRSVDVYVGKLRQKLADALPGRELIHTHFGLGYRFTSFLQDGHRSVTDSS
jgi:DNA-binding response OmpR family regulator